MANRYGDSLGKVLKLLQAEVCPQSNASIRELRRSYVLLMIDNTADKNTDYNQQNPRNAGTFT